MTLRALEMEYRIFSGTTVITIYRRKMALLTSQIKKDTDKFNLHVPVIEANTVVPGISSDTETEQTNAGFIKASQMAFSVPTIVEEKSFEEPEVKIPPVEQSPVGKKRVSRLIATADGSYEPISTSTQKPICDDDLIAKAKEIEARLSSTLSLMSKSTGADVIAKPNNSVKSDKDRSSKSSNGTSRSSKQSSKESSKSSSFKSSKRSLDRQTSLDKFFTSKRQKLDSNPDCKTEASSDGNPAVKSETLIKKEKHHRFEALFDSESDSSTSKITTPKCNKRSSSDIKIKQSPSKEITGQKLDCFKSPACKKPDKPKISSSNSAEKKKSSSPDKNKQDIANLVKSI